MLERIFRIDAGIKNFLWYDLYGMRQIHKNLEKQHHSSIRSGYFTVITGAPMIAGGFLASVVAASYMGVGLSTLGATIGSVFPVVGTAAGALIGLVIGVCIGAVTGWKLGAEAGGFFGSFIAKHSARLVSTLFNWHEANPSNVNKYKLSLQEENSPNITKVRKVIHNNFKATETITYKNNINKKLALCYENKKLLKSNTFLRAVGLNHLFWNKSQQLLNAEINKTVATLKSDTTMEKREEAFNRLGSLMFGVD